MKPTLTELQSAIRERIDGGEAGWRWKVLDELAAVALDTLPLDTLTPAEWSCLSRDQVDALRALHRAQEASDAHALRFGEPFSLLTSSASSLPMTVVLDAVGYGHLVAEVERPRSGGRVELLTAAAPYLRRIP